MPDTVAVSGASIAVLLGDGQGHFSATTYSLPFLGHSLALVDADNDGTLDAVVGGSGGIATLLGDGRGGLGPPIVTPGGVGNSLLAADFDRDGHIDLAAFSDDLHGPILAMGGGDGTFVVRALGVSNARNPLEVGDLNGDGTPDLLTDESQGGLVVLLGDGLGGFTEAQRSVGSAAGLSLADFDGDGRLDLLQGDSSALRFFAGNGDGTFRGGQVVLESGVPNVFSIADFNRDGKPDLVGRYTSNQVWLFRGFGDGSFNPLPDPLDAPDEPYWFGAADLDRDGAQDLLVSSTSGVVAWLGNAPTPSAGRACSPGALFSTGEEMTVPLGSRFLQIVDVNHDGRPDLVTGNHLGVSVRLAQPDGGYRLPIDTGMPLAPDDFLLTDLDGDGLLDMVKLSSMIHHVVARPGAPDAGFGPVSVLSLEGFSGQLLAADRTGDGTRQVLVRSEVNEVARVFVFELVGGALVHKEVLDFPFNPGLLLAADLDGDGADELLVTAPNDGQLWIYPGGHCNIAQPRAYAVAPGLFTGTIADLDRDGHPDVVLSGRSGAQVLWNDGHGDLVDRLDVSGGGEVISAADLDQDGLPDLLFSGGWTGSRITDDLVDYRSMGGGFRSAAPLLQAPGGTDEALGVDLDGDGLTDLVTLSSFRSRLTVFWGCPRP